MQVYSLKSHTIRQTETDRQTNKQTDGKTHRQTDEQTDRQTDRRTDRQTDRRTDRQTDRRTDRQTDRQMEAVPTWVPRPSRMSMKKKSRDHRGEMGSRVRASG